MKRIESLDIMRGITIIGMIVVNNAGDALPWQSFHHSAWNGLTPCDLVFPFFLFIVGITSYLSHGSLLKILKRTALILLIGWALNWLNAGINGHGWGLSSLRLTGVLPRIAICYALTALTGLYVKHSRIAWISAALLIAYGVLLSIGNGYSPDSSNILARIDQAVLGKEHLYTKHAIDPEGLASSIGAIAHCLIGFCLGKYFCDRSQSREALTKTFVCGSLLLIAGYLLVELWPLNKRIWSPSYTLVSSGLAALLLSTLRYFELKRGEKKAGIMAKVCLIYGINPIAIYVLSEILAMVMDIHPAVLLIITGAAGAILYKKKIYIKL